MYVALIILAVILGIVAAIIKHRRKTKQLAHLEELTRQLKKETDRMNKWLERNQ